MKIAIVRPFPSVLNDASYNVQEFGLARALVSQGIDVDVYCAGNGTEKSISILEEGREARARVIKLFYKEIPPHNGIFPELIPLLDQGNYDLIQTQDFEQLTVFLVARVAVKRKIPFVIHQGVYDNRQYGRFMSLWVKVFRETCGRYLRKHVSGCIAKTATAEHYLQEAGFAGIEVLPIGLNTSRFKSLADVDWRKKVGIDEGTKVLLYVGLIEKRRNVDFLISVTSHLVKAGENVSLLIAGKGPEEGNCKNLTAKLGLEKQVVFLGKVDQQDLPGLYKSADFFLLASNSEIVGMVLLESLFFGVPILSTKTAGGKDIVDPRFGQLFDGLNVEEWASFIAASFKDPAGFDFRKNLKRFPFERSWETLSERYALFYKRICAAYHAPV